MKVVLDTNVVVSGLLHSEGNPGQILALALSGAVQICHDERILAEYREVLARPRLKLNPERVKEILVKLATDGTAVRTGTEQWNLPDADDEPFLAVTFSAPADYLITGNIRHYPGNQRKGCSVVTPVEFMEIWRRGSR